MISKNPKQTQSFEFFKNVSTSPTVKQRQNKIRRNLCKRLLRPTTPPQLTHKNWQHSAVSRELTAVAWTSNCGVKYNVYLLFVLLFFFFNKHWILLLKLIIIVCFSSVVLDLDDGVVQLTQINFSAWEEVSTYIMSPVILMLFFLLVSKLLKARQISGIIFAGPAVQ